MSERDAALCSFHEYQLRVQGYEKRMQHDWELSRWQVWQLLAPNYKKGQAPRTPQAFCRFPWEQQNDDEIMAAYERSRITEQEQAWLDKLFPKHDNVES